MHVPQVRSSLCLVGLSVGLALLMSAACDAQPAGTESVGVEGLQAVRKQATVMMDDAVESAAETLEVSKKRLGDVSDTICHSLYGEKTRSLESSGHLAVEDRSRAQTLDAIDEAWTGLGWTTKRSAPDTSHPVDSISSTKMLDNGVKVLVWAKLQPGEARRSWNVRFSTSTTCLELSDAAYETLRDEPFEEPIDE